MDAPALRPFGKWQQAGVPKKGWTCVGYHDLGEDDKDVRPICQMCEHRQIRYVHRMSHPEYPDVLECGMHCAGHMEQDYAQAEEREGEMRRAASRRRSRWKSYQKRRTAQRMVLHTHGWRISKNDNEWTEYLDHRIVILPGRGGWRANVYTGDSLISTVPPPPSRDKAELKKAALDFVDGTVEADITGTARTPEK
jgi:hypothetical protein